MQVIDALEKCISLKTWIVEDFPDDADLHPVIFGEINGTAVIMAIAPEVDKYKAFKAAKFLRLTLGIDALTLVTDAHCTATKEAAMRDWKAGEMQKACDNEGLCETGAITDTLTGIRMDDQMRIDMANHPYAFHGSGSKLVWNTEMISLMNNCTYVDPEVAEKETAKIREEWDKSGESKDTTPNDGSHDKEGTKISGFVPGMMKEIMEADSPFKLVTTEWASQMGITPHQYYYHAISTAADTLRTMGFFVETLAIAKPEPSTNAWKLEDGWDAITV